MCWDRDVDNGGRRVWPQIDAGILVYFRHGKMATEVASTVSNQKKDQGQFRAPWWSVACWDGIWQRRLKAKGGTDEALFLRGRKRFWHGHRPPAGPTPEYTTS